MMADSLSLQEIARALGGEISGRQVLAPGPGHSPKDRSLAISLHRDAPDGFVLHSFADDDWKTCRDFVRWKLNLPDWQPGDGREAQRTIPRSHIEKWDFSVMDGEALDQRRTEDDLVRIERAKKIWNEALDPRGTAAEKFLRARALDLQNRFAGDVLRFHPRTPWRNENTGQTDRIPCLIAAFRSIDDDEITGIHRIRLDQPERWPKTQRMMLGVVRRAAVKLDPVGPSLAISEGIETAMAAIQLGLGATWALGSVGNISFFPTIVDVKELTILGEAGDASARAIKICGRRWRRSSRRVFVSLPTIGSDHNDILMQRVS
jgi:putative DNA primase/helicase